MKTLCILVTLFTLFITSTQDQAQDGPFRLPGQREDTIPHPLIQDILQEISEDSLASHIAFLQNMGTRFMYAENRKQVAEWIAARFQSYGVNHVEIDSFRIAGDTILTDTVWQYNVVATLEGTSAPGEIYILGAHHDDYSDTNLYLFAPGANDNASGCALAFEFARICQKKQFQPASTIRLITFAAEELTGYKKNSGSIDYANRLHENQEDLRLMINNDMIAYSTEPEGELRATAISTGLSQWPGILSLQSSSLYSSISLIPSIYPTADADPFNQLGYPVAGLESVVLPPTYHTINDSLSHCQMNLVAGAARVISAILLSEQLMPVPQYLTCAAGKTYVKLSWKSTRNHHVSGYRIYRSEMPDSGFVLLGTAQGMDSCYSDSTLMMGKTWYYRVTSLGDSGFESLPSNVANGALAPHDRELLVVKDSRGGYMDPGDQEVMDFYQTVFEGLEAEITDASQTDTLQIGLLARYRKIFWLSNTYSNQSGSAFRNRQEEIAQYLNSGGQLFLASFQPSFLTGGNTYMNKEFTSDQTVYQLYKIKSVERKPAAFLNGAIPAATDYDSLQVDPLKTPEEPIGHLPNVECITPTPDASLIYRFNSSFDSTSNPGSMKGKPVGIEYLGSDYKLILLSVPIYYLDTSDAVTLVNLVAKEKFNSFIGVEDQDLSEKNILKLDLIPNPATSSLSVRFNLPRSTDVNLYVTDLTGRCFTETRSLRLTAGQHRLALPVYHLSSGIYLVILQTREGTGVAKLIVQ